ncbi:MAG: hypothetical protein GX256_00085 [Fretibacterium sp.]|nr:hypothetical protein [Fretibacterium sp.]
MTARIVDELAAALLPPLKLAVVEKLTENTAEERKARLGINEELKGFHLRLKKIEDGIAALKDTPDKTKHSLESLLIALREGAEAYPLKNAPTREAARRPKVTMRAVARSVAPRPKRLSPPLLAASRFRGLSNALKKRETEGLQELIEQHILEWEGFLRGATRAQTQELDALSREVSELQKDTRAALLQELRELLLHEFAEKNEAQLREARTDVAELVQKMALFQRLAVLIGGLCAGALLFLGIAVWLS